MKHRKIKNISQDDSVITQWERQNVNPGYLAPGFVILCSPAQCQETHNIQEQEQNILCCTSSHYFLLLFFFFFLNLDPFVSLYSAFLHAWWLLIISENKSHLKRFCFLPHSLLSNWYILSSESSQKLKVHTFFLNTCLYLTNILFPIR